MMGLSGGIRISRGFSESPQQNPRREWAFRSGGAFNEVSMRSPVPEKAQGFIRLRQNTLWPATGMNGEVTAARLEEGRRVGFGAIPL
jgi:hypothetical protein